MVYLKTTAILLCGLILKRKNKLNENKYLPVYIYNMPTKKEVIETVYFRPDGFGSLKQVTKDAQLKDETVTYEDVREWKSKQTFGQKLKPYGNNSFYSSGTLPRISM